MPPHRVPIRQAVRLEIASSQQWKCATCHKVLHRDLPHLFHIDHIVPLHQEGAHARSNWQALCLDCHATKTAREMKELHQKGNIPNWILIPYEPPNIVRSPYFCTTK